MPREHSTRTDGFEATAAIREAERVQGGHIPIVAMTAHAIAGNRQRWLQAGMDAGDRAFAEVLAIDS